MPWPYMESQCPDCQYFTPFERPREDDQGYAVPGACAHPSIAMELFVSEARPELGRMRCTLHVTRRSMFVDRSASRRASTDSRRRGRAA